MGTHDAISLRAHANAWPLVVGILATACSAPAPTIGGEPSTAPAANALTDPTRSTPGAHNAGPAVEPRVPRCAPRPLSSAVEPRWTTAAVAHAPACTDEQARTLIECVWNGEATSGASCDAFFDAAESASCLACAVSDAQAGVASPLLAWTESSSTYIYTNEGACVAAVSGDSTAGGCGAKIAARAACHDAACGDCSSLDDWTECTAASDTTMCAAYVNESNCETPYAGQCYAGTELDTAMRLVRTMCTGL